MEKLQGTVEGDMAFLQEDPDPCGKREQVVLCLVFLPHGHYHRGLPILLEAA